MVGGGFLFVALPSFFFQMGPWERDFGDALRFFSRRAGIGEGGLIGSDTGSFFRLWQILFFGGGFPDFLCQLCMWPPPPALYGGVGIARLGETGF